MRKLIEAEFCRGAAVPLLFFPPDGIEIPDSPKLTVIVAEPNAQWSSHATIRQQIAEWTKRRGKSDRLYPGALIWCLKKPGRELRDRIKLWLAWKRVAHEVAEGSLGADCAASFRAATSGWLLASAATHL